MSDHLNSQFQLHQDATENSSADDNNNNIDLDTAALLQSLADFEHPASYHQIPVPAEDFPSPEVPTAGDGLRLGNQNLNPFNGNALRRPSGTVNTSQPTQRKRKAPADADDEPEVGFVRLSKSKKPKKQLQVIADDTAGGRSEDPLASGVKASSRKEARAAGVHSAAALFRPPTEASKKYTRVAISTVYHQLEVSQKRFFELQNAAKAYMLDPKHPDRASAVSQRGKGDTDMTKFKLFSCVSSFLDMGWGEKCWGKAEPTPPDADGSPAAHHRTLQWPGSKDDIVTMVLPLFRRVVSNERQRLYALDTRRKAAAAKKLENSRELSSTPTEEGTPQPHGKRTSAPSNSPYPVIDPKLSENNDSADKSSPIQHASTSKTQNGTMSIIHNEPAGGALTYVMNFMQNGRRITPKITLPSGISPDYSTLVQQIDGAINDGSLKLAIKVLGPGTWLNVSNDEEWKKAITVVKDSEILDGEVKCVVEISEA